MSTLSATRSRTQPTLLSRITSRFGITMHLTRALLAVSLLITSTTVLGTGTSSAPTCERCVKSAGSLYDVLSAASRRSSAMVNLQERICGSHPAEGQGLCWEILNRRVPSLVRKFRSQPVVCSDLGLCTKAEAVSLTGKTNITDMSCPLCEYLMVTLKEQLDDPATEEEVVDQANAVCYSLPTEAQNSCHQYVKEYGKQIFAWVHSSNPETVCTMIGVCDQSERLPALPAPLRQAAAQLLAVNDDDQCNTCQLVVIEASSAISDPATQKEILEYVKQSCKDFQSFKEQCENYVDLYGPTILAMAKQYLKPELCTQLGFCTATRAEELIITA